LSRRADLDRAGGMEYIAALIDVVPTAANVDYHAKIVRDKAVLRRLVEAATGIHPGHLRRTRDGGEVLDNAEHRVFQVAQVRRAEEFIRIKSSSGRPWSGSSSSSRVRARSPACRAVSPIWTVSRQGSSAPIWSFSPPGHRWERRRSP